MISLIIFSFSGIFLLKKTQKKEEEKEEITYQHPWNIQDFREKGYKIIDFMCDYYQNIESKDVLSKVEPGYLSKLIPKEAPKSSFFIFNF